MAPERRRTELEVVLPSLGAARYRGCAQLGMTQPTRERRLVYVRSADMELWSCRPIGMVDVLDLRDRRVGRFDGLIVDAQKRQPLFVVIRREGAGSAWFLAPVGDGWFDQTARAIRIDVKLRNAPSFDPAEFERMTPEEASAYERKILAECCPEVGLHRDGTPDYERHPVFTCPSWLRAPTSASP